MFFLLLTSCQQQNKELMNLCFEILFMKKLPNLANQKCKLHLRNIFFTYTFHMVFIMLKKNSLTTHLLLTNPTAVFLRSGWLWRSFTTASNSFAFYRIAEGGFMMNIRLMRSKPLLFVSCSFLASWTFEWILVPLQWWRRLSLSVDPFVCSQVPYLVKTFATLFTLMRLFSGVGSVMHSEVPFCTETLATLFTFKGL